MRHLIILFFFICYKGWCQDAKADFKKINQVYAASQKLSMGVTYELFFDNNIKPSDTETGSYKKDGDTYFVKQSNNEMMINKKYMVVVDNDNKTIIVDHAGKKLNPLDPLKVDIDSIFKLYSKVEFYKTGKNNEYNAYKFTLKAGPYTQIDIVFDAKTYLVKEIINLYREKMPDEKNVERKAILKTSFSNIKTDPIYHHEFSEENYVSNYKGKVALIAKYSKYKLLTNLKKI